MKTSLIIVESPAKVKTIKKFLNSSYKVEATMGHIRDLPKSQLGIDIDNNYEPKYITIRGKGPTIEKLKKEAKGCDKIFLATDPDREGEAISWHLAKILGIDTDKACRIEFNEITKTAVTSAIKKPRKLNLDLIDAQQARRVLDRLVGYKISPLLWKKIRKGLSAGRVQSVSVRLICDREEEIVSFVPEEYWTLNAKLTDVNSQNTFEAKFYGNQSKKIDMNSKEQVDKIINDLNKDEFKVSKVKRGEKKRNAPLPFTTSTLQQEANKKLGFTTKKTMMLAQQLYEGIDIKGEGTVGLVTYIRTDSTRLSEEAKNDLGKYIEKRFGKEFRNDEIKQTKIDKKVQDAHEAIRPTYLYKEPSTLVDSLEKDQLKLYKLIWDRFVSSQMNPAIYDSVTADILSGDYLFKATGSILKFPGFLLIYKDSKDSEEDHKDVLLPNLEEDQKLILKKIESKQHFTEALPRYTEATLVKALEEKGIGRPSTYSPTISTILARGYVIKDKKMFIPTELGITVTALLKEFFPDIVNAEFTAIMENKLDNIEDGEKDWIKIIDEFYKPFEITLINAEEKIGKIEIQDEISDIICEFCGRNMVIKQGRYGKFLACPGFPVCKNAKPIVQGTGIKCPKCEGEIIQRKTKKGRTFYGCSKYPECDFVTWDEPVNEKCPQCEKNLTKTKGKSIVKYKCMNENCGFERIDKEKV